METVTKPFCVLYVIAVVWIVKSYPGEGGVSYPGGRGKLPGGEG
jgi:hypothetical protein